MPHLESQWNAELLEKGVSSFSREKIATFKTLLVCLFAGVSLLPSSVSGQRIEIENLYGSVSIQSRMGGDRLEAQGFSPDGESRDDALDITYGTGSASIRCRTQTDSPVNVVVTVPHTALIRVVTGSDSIRLDGLVRWAQFDTESGNIEISVPLSLLRLRMLADVEPRSLVKPGHREVVLLSGRRERLWALAEAPRSAIRGRLLSPSLFDQVWSSGRLGVYCTLMVRAERPGIIRIVDAPLPPNSWVIPPSQAERVVDSSVPRIFLEPGGNGPDANRELPENRPTFRTEVRLVSIQVAVHDEYGRAVSGLSAKDFSITEDGVDQKLAFVSSEETPLDLTLLLDLSDSTLLNRANLLAAARRFVGLARDGDRAGVCAIADTLFHIVSPLSSDHARTKRLLDSIPSIGGATPLYDSVLLAANAARANDPRRAAVLVVISDGHDTASAPLAMPGGSAVSFAELKRTLMEWPVTIYSVLVRASQFNSLSARVAERRMQELADLSGGRTFTATPGELDGPAFAELNAELRSIYAVGYYPLDQSFNGEWREVKVHTPTGRIPRARRGYFAR